MNLTAELKRQKWMYISGIILMFSVLKPKTAYGCRTTFYVASKDCTDASAAQNSCSRFGGKLASGEKLMKEKDLIATLNEKYVRDLQRIWIFFNAKSKNYKYATTKNESLRWRLARKNGVLAFDLYKSASPERKEVYLCQPPSNQSNLTTVLQSSKCKTGWTTKIFYGGKSLTPSYKELYIFARSNGSDDRLVTNTIQPRNKMFRVRLQSIYAADIKVFIGAKFNVSAHQWQWINGTRADFKMPTRRACLQKVIHYDNGWQHRNVKCANQLAYYACQFEYAVSMRALSCNGTAIKVQIAENLHKLAIFTNQTIQVEIKVRDAETNRYQNKSTTSSELEVVFGNLRPNRTYFVSTDTIVHPPQLVTSTVTARSSKNKQTIILHKLMNLTTGHVIPEPVMTGHVVRTESCVIELPGQLTNGEAFEYRIIASSNRNKTVENFNINASNRSPFHNLSLSLWQHPRGATVTFQVQVATCSGTSELRPVSGNCTASHEVQIRTELNIIAVIGLAGAVGLVIVGVLALSIYMLGRNSKTKINKSATSDLSEKGQQGEYKNKEQHMETMPGLMTSEVLLTSAQGKETRVEVEENAYYVKPISYDSEELKEDGYMKVIETSGQRDCDVTAAADTRSGGAYVDLTVKQENVRYMEPISYNTGEPNEYGYSRTSDADEKMKSDGGYLQSIDFQRYQNISCFDESALNALYENA